MFIRLSAHDDRVPRVIKAYSDTLSMRNAANVYTVRSDEVVLVQAERRTYAHAPGDIRRRRSDRLMYNEGIEDRVATFETTLRTAEDIRGWFDGRHPIIMVVECGAIW